MNKKHQMALENLNKKQINAEIYRAELMNNELMMSHKSFEVALVNASFEFERFK